MTTGKNDALAQLAKTPFRPVWWARGGLAQTIAAAYGSRRRVALALERWDTADGDFVRLHFGAAAPTQPLVLLLHGLEGSIASPYVAATASAVQARGWQLAVLEFRSCGGEPNRLPRSYHSGDTGDLDFVVRELRRRHPHRRLYLLGFSLGGNVLLKWLGERGDAVPAGVAAAAAISPPFDLAASARAADARYRGLLARHFLATLVPKALAKARRFPGLLDVDAVRRCRSFAAFDDLVTAPLHGFDDAAHYWGASSCAAFVAAIRRPTLLITAEDDPLCPAAGIPRAQVAASPFLVPQFERHGGHCGFVDGGAPWRCRRWAEAQAVRFFALHEAALGAGPATMHA